MDTDCQYEREGYKPPRFFSWKILCLSSEVKFLKKVFFCEDIMMFNPGAEAFVPKDISVIMSRWHLIWL